MNRNSLGQGIFSPIRNDISFNDSIFNSDDASGSISEAMKEQTPMFKSVGGMHLRSANLSEKENDQKKNVGNQREEKSLKDPIKERKSKSSSKSTDAQKATITIPKICTTDVNDNLPSEMTESKELEKKRSSHKSSRHSKDKSSRSSSSKTSTSHITKRNDNECSASTFVTVRNDRRKNAQSSDYKRSSSKSAAFVMSPHLENSEDLPDTSPTSAISGSFDKTITYEKVQKDNGSLQPSQSILNINQVRQKSDVEVKQTVKKPTDLPLSTKSSTSASKRQLRMELPQDSSVNQSSQPIQIQGNIIEKLIKETVSFEFDAIRQQMYLQHFSLLKLLNTRMDEFEKENVDKSENLFQVIAELMEENRELRKHLLARQ